MKKKTNLNKEKAPKKVLTKKVTPKKAIAEKAIVKKAAPKKAAPKSAKLIEARATESFRPVCITQGVRLDERCMSESEAFEIAQEHRRQTQHRVDIESC